MSKVLVCKCNICGKEIPDIERDHFSIKGRIGYGSKHDGDELELDICNDCLDKLIEKCKLWPIKPLEM